MSIVVDNQSDSWCGFVLFVATVAETHLQFGRTPHGSAGYFFGHYRTVHVRRLANSYHRREDSI